MEIASLAISVDSREVRTAREWLDHLTGAGTRAERSLGRVGAGGKTAASGSRESAAASREAARAMDSQASSAQRLTAMIRSYATAVVGAFGAREIIQAADAWQGLENRLRLVTRSHTELQVAMNDVYGIAQRTSQQIDSVGQVYQRFAMNAGALGITQKQVAELAETTAKAIAVSGSEAAAAEGALMQFGQALAAGVLRGEEFNSVMEGAPGLAQALARGLGVPVGALRQLAADGEITGNKIVEALTKARDSVDTQFETRIKTVSQAMIELGNSVTRYIGELSGATGATSGLADGITRLAQAIDDARSSMDGVNRELDAYRTFGEVVQEAWEAVDQFSQDFARMLGASEGGVRSLGDHIVTSFERSFLDTARELDALYDAFMGTIASIGAGFRTLGENIAAAFVWGFQKALASFSELTTIVSDWLNSTFKTDRFNFTIADDPGELRLKSLREEADRARAAVEGTLGAYDALALRIGDKGIWRAAEEAMAAYSDDVKAAGSALDVFTAATDKKKRKLTEAEKTQQAFERSRRQYLNGLYGEISALQDQARGLEEQIALYGLAESAKYDLAIADLEAQQAALAVIDAGAEEIAILERKIELLQQMKGSQQTLERLDAEKQAWETWSRDVEQIFQQVGQSLTDAIFEGGKSARDLIKDLFKTLTLRVVIQPMLSGLQGMVTQQLGGLLGYQDPRQQGGSGILGTAQNLYSGYNAITGGLNSTLGNAAQWLGQKVGSEALTSFGLGLSGTTAATGIASIGAGLGASLGTSIGTSAAAMTTTSFSAALSGGALVPGLGVGAAGGGVGAGIGAAGAAGGAAAGGAAGIGSAIGAALPWIGGALAIGSILGGGLFDREPTTRREQRTQVEYSGGSLGVTQTDDRAQAGTDAAVAQMTAAAIESANSLFRQIGIDAAIDSFHAILASSYQGDRDGVASGGRLRIGDRLVDIGIPDDENPTIKGFGGWSSAETLPRLATDIQLTVLEAFQSLSDQLPNVLASMLEGIDIRSLGEQEAQALAERFTLLTQGASQFLAAIETMPFEQLRDLSFDAAAGMVQFAGGIDNLLSAQQTYYDRYYSEQEKFEHSVNQLSQALSGVGVVMPELTGSTDDMLASYRRLVESLDLNTEAGQQAYVVLMQSAGAFADVAQYAGQAAAEVDNAGRTLADITRERLGLEAQLLQLQGNTAELRRRELEALDESNRGLQQRIWALQDQAAIASQRAGLEAQLLQLQGDTAELRRRELAALDPANRALQEHIWLIQDQQSAWNAAVAAGEAAYSALTRSVSAEKSRLQREAQQIATALRDAISSSSSRVGDLQRLTSRLSSTISSMVGEVMGEARNLSWAQQRIDRALSVARLTGVMPTGDDFEEALQLVARPSEGLYSSFEDYQADFLRTAHVIRQLNELAGGQLSTEEQTLASLQTQLTHSQEWYQAEVARLDEMLEYQRQQLDMAKGEHEALLSIPAALAGIASAISSIQITAAATNYGGGGGGGGNSYYDAKLAQLQSIGSTHGGIDWTKASTADLAAYFAQEGLTPQEHWEKWGKNEGLPRPSFDVGTNYVPYDMVAQIHEGERIIPAADNRALMQAILGSRSQDNEVRLLRQELREMRLMQQRLLDEIAQNTYDTSRTNREMTETPQPVRVTNVVPTVEATIGS